MVISGHAWRAVYGKGIGQGKQQNGKRIEPRLAKAVGAKLLGIKRQYLMNSYALFSGYFCQFSLVHILNIFKHGLFLSLTFIMHSL
jgi:hypothetical protein